MGEIRILETVRMGSMNIVSISIEDFERVAEGARHRHTRKRLQEVRCHCNHPQRIHANGWGKCAGSRLEQLPDAPSLAVPKECPCGLYRRQAATA